MRAYRLGLLVISIAVISDQLSKLWLLFGDTFGGGWLTPTPRAITFFMDFTLVYNRGISYGLLAQDSTIARLILIAITLLIVTILLWQMRRETHHLTIIAFGLIIGGAIGNVIDRIAHGAVIDFISLHAFNYYWYVFNIADIWITFGVAMLVLLFIFPPRD